jgi:hypothetical protein
MTRRIPSITSDVLIAAVTGVIAAVSVIPFCVIALVVCGVATLRNAGSRLRAGRARMAIFGVLGSTLVFIGIVVAAASYRPCKVVEQVLQREITLPSTRMTLAELSYVASYERRSFPIHMSFCFADADRDIVVEWPRRDLTIREFLDAIESQTLLRRRFMHCGNGYTVLGGGDCCFGLYIRDPELAVPPFPRERFDVDAYATIREKQTH